MNKSHKSGEWMQPKYSEKGLNVGNSMKSFLFVAVTAFTIAMSGAVKAETLTDTLIKAYKHSGLLEQNRAVLRAADEDVAQAVATLRPVINYFATATFSSSPVLTGLNNGHLTGNLGISASLLLYDGGGSKLAIDSAKETVLATRQGLISIEQAVLLRAVTAYMNVRRDNEFVALRRNNVRVIAEQLRAAKDRFEVGEVTRTDVSLAESRLALARANRAVADGNLARSREEYRAATGTYPKSLRTAPKAPATARSLESARAIAYTTHPAMKKIQHEIAATEIGVLRAEALMPGRELYHASHGSMRAHVSLTQNNFFPDL